MKRAGASASILLMLLVLSGCSTSDPGESAGLNAFAGSPPAERVDELVLLIHGSGDGAGSWPAQARDAMAASGTGRLRRILVVDWEAAAENRPAAPRRGARIGRDIAHALRRSWPAPRQVVLVSHSAGAFVAHGFAAALRNENGAAAGGGSWDQVSVTQLFLDPFLARSPLAWRYGARRFGEHADRAFAWVNTDDPVPFTSRFPRHAESRDLTGRRDLREDAAALTDSQAPGHWLPVAAFIRLIEEMSPDATFRETLEQANSDMMRGLPKASMRDEKTATQPPPS
ncbi:MAG: alpha/beta fold hydrolase [Spirochaetaceae bacterium]